MAFGTFDLLHPGHVAFLEQAKQSGDHLSVVIARDANVKKIKGDFPKQDEQARHDAVVNTAIPDRVILGDLDDFYVPIRSTQPDLIVMGYDQRVNVTRLQRDFPTIQLIRAKAFFPEKYKSSLMKRCKIED